MPPTIGEVVIYVDTGWIVGERRNVPAIVTRVDPRTGALDLFVMTVEDSFHAHATHYDASTHPAVGTWHHRRSHG
jgi:hypothetical protein